MDTFRQFEVVLEIERSGSISQAAASLHISQPTLSKLLHKIENDLGVELFDRTVSPLKITKAGEAFIESGRKIMDARHCLKKEIEEIKSGNAPELIIGVSPSRAHHIIPPVIKEYQETLSKETENSPKIFFKECVTRQLNKELEKGTLDLIINIESEETAEFAKVELFEEKILLACPKGKHSDALDALRNNSYIAIGRGQVLSKTYQLVKDSFDGKEANIECQSIELALSLVNNGMGVTFVPSYFSSSNVYENVEYLKLPEEWYAKYPKRLIRKICLFYRNKRFLNSSEKRFISICEKLLK